MNSRQAVLANIRRALGVAGNEAILRPASSIPSFSSEAKSLGEGCVLA